MAPRCLLFDFKLISDAKIQPVISKYKQGRQRLFTFLNIVTRWSRSTSNFYAVIGQNLTGEFMQTIYTASWNLFTLTAEAYRVFLSTCDVFYCLFPLDAWNEIQPLSTVFCYSLLVCLLNFWFRNAPLVKVGNPILDDIVFVFHLARCGLKSPSSNSGLTW